MKRGCRSVRKEVFEGNRGSVPSRIASFRKRITSRQGFSLFSSSFLFEIEILNRATRRSRFGQRRYRMRRCKLRDYARYEMRHQRSFFAKRQMVQRGLCGHKLRKARSCFWSFRAGNVRNRDLFNRDLTANPRTRAINAFVTRPTELLFGKTSFSNGNASSRASAG